MKLVSVGTKVAAAALLCTQGGPALAATKTAGAVAGSSVSSQFPFFVAILLALLLALGVIITRGLLGQGAHALYRLLQSLLGGGYGSVGTGK
jgi:hypothetical protein